MKMKKKQNFIMLILFINIIIVQFVEQLKLQKNEQKEKITIVEVILVKFVKIVIF